MAKRTPATYVWRTENDARWAVATRLLPTNEEGGEERTAIGAWECDGHACGFTAQDKSDVALIPVCLGNGGDERGAIVLCDTFVAAGGSPTKECTRPVLVERLGQPEANGLGLHVGFTVQIKGVGGSTDDPTSSPLAKDLLASRLGLASMRWTSNNEFEVVVDMESALEAADHCELVQALAKITGHKARVTQVWVSTAASREDSGAASLLSRLTAASSGAGVSANSRTGRFYIPASVARLGKGHYVDQKPADCKNSYQYVMNVLDLWKA
jgi:hypothetical protein